MEKIDKNSRHFFPQLFLIKNEKNWYVYFLFSILSHLEENVCFLYQIHFMNKRQYIVTYIYFLFEQNKPI